MTIICFGDSNTFGFDPRSYFGGRYEQPWTDILAELTGWTVRNNGMNGREIPRRAVSFPQNADLIAVMLGTNDLLQGASAETAAARMEAFLRTLDREKVLMLAPPPLAQGEWVTDQSLIKESEELARRYRTMAGRLNVRFADAGGWNIPLCFDGVHFTEEGHRRFAEGLRKELTDA